MTKLPARRVIRLDDQDLCSGYSKQARPLLEALLAAPHQIDCLVLHSRPEDAARFSALRLQRAIDI